MEGGNKVEVAELGGSVLTSTLGNPLGVLARQLSYTLHKLIQQCPLHRVDGKLVDEYLGKIKWRLLIMSFWTRSR
uniref:Uncharacterized protein n=1 Tax=Solanum lycopersicum TaxID=4081 RepID=A0A3Q7GFJ5_SOLLC